MRWYSGKHNLVLVAIIVLAVLARLFCLFVFPDAGLNDGLLHLSLAKELTGKLDFAVSLPPPLQHFALASFYAFTGLEWKGLALKIIPFVLSILLLAGSFVLFKKVFPSNQLLFLLAFAFVAINPWMILYFSINYTEAFVVTSLVFMGIFAFNFFEKPSLVNSLLFGFSVGFLAISKLNATVIAVSVFAASFVLVLCYHKKLFESIKRAFNVLIFFVLFSVVIPLAWFLSEYFKHGYFILPNVFEYSLFVYFPPEPTNPVFTFLKSIFLSIINFWGYPLPSMALKILQPGLLFPSMVVFFFLMLLLGLALLTGYFLLLKNNPNRLFFLVIFIVIGANLLFILTHGNPFLIGDSLYWRYFIPVLPFVAIPFTIGLNFFRHKSKEFFKIATASFFAFALFSAAYAGYFSFHFYKSHSGYEELYGYLDTLPGGSAVFNADLGRQIDFFSSAPMCSASTWDTDLARDPKAIVFHSPPAEAARIMREGSCTHLVVTTYYREAWKPEQIDAMLEQGVLEKLFERESFVVYEIK